MAYLKLVGLCPCLTFVLVHLEYHPSRRAMHVPNHHKYKWPLGHKLEMWATSRIRTKVRYRQKPTNTRLVHDLSRWTVKAEWATVKLNNAKKKTQTTLELRPLILFNWTEITKISGHNASIFKPNIRVGPKVQIG